MKELTIAQAEELVGQRLDRRFKYATTDDGKPDAYLGNAILFSLGSWVQSCSGCHETIDGHPVGPETYDKNGIALGSGCHECGYQGKVRESMWLPHDLPQATVRREG